MNKMLLDMLISSNPQSEEELENTLSELSGLSMFKGCTKEEIDEVRIRYLEKVATKQDEGYESSAKDYKPWFNERFKSLDMDRWEAYKTYLRHDKDFDPTPINRMEDDLKRITDLLGDPKDSASFERKGLVIGDVQSGKTANYIGLMNMAVDAGYNVIILMTGIIEKLRVQTQERVEEGFVGRSTNVLKKKGEYIGIAKTQKNLSSTTLTTCTLDFNASSAQSSVFSNISTTPIVFVIKKNVRIMDNLNEWLEQFVDSNNKIHANLLVIDDEADYGSVNTTKSDDPDKMSATPKQIVRMLQKFTKSCYVGYTATPYANIFINPGSDEEMAKDSLFPRNFVYCLSSPSTYVGPEQIFGENAQYDYMIKELGNIPRKFDDPNNYAKDSVWRLLPINHKITQTIDELPASLIEAINCFLIANTIVDLSGKSKTNRTMMVNMTKYINIQNRLGDLINNYVKEVRDIAKLHGNISKKSNYSKYFSEIIQTYDRNYKNEKYSIEQIISELYNSISTIEVIVVNTSNKNGLNYSGYVDGRRIIAVGGQALSRGLTLEGLLITYFYRNPKYYDTLMQMGRWFGYKKSYANLCKVWMPTDTVNWYREISSATEELKDRIKSFRDTSLTPMDFGLSVRHDIETLRITAANKMRTSEEIERRISLSQDVIETKYISYSLDHLKSNANAVNYLIRTCSDNAKVINDRFGFNNVDKSVIIKFMDLFYSPANLNIGFDTKILGNFIRGYDGDELNNWDIEFISGENQKEFDVICDHKVYKSNRQFLCDDSDILQVSRKSAKLGNPTDSLYGLNDEQKAELKKMESEKRLKNPDKPNVHLSQKEYFKLTEHPRNPLLIIYNISPIIRNNENEKQYTRTEEHISKIFNKNSEEYIGCDLYGLTIGIPTLNNEESHLVKYVRNIVAQELNQDGDEDLFDYDE